MSTACQHGVHGSCGTCALLDAIAVARALLGGGR